MPAKPSWFPRLPEILEEVEQLSTPLLDRATIERLFRLRRRQSIALLHRLGGYQAGRTFLVERTSVLGFLRALARGDDYALESRRRTRLADELTHLRRLHPATLVTIPVAPRAPDSLEGLPSGITLRPGEMRVAFQGATDLLQKLLELSQAAANDFERFRTLVE